MLGLDFPTIITRVITLIIALTFHEFSHAWTANYFGDDTPRLHGRLTLNPLHHLDVMGSLMLIMVGFGWAKPVPVNPYALQRRSPAALMWVSLAGPGSNFLLALLAAIPIRLGITAPFFLASSKFFPSLSDIVYQFMWINLALMLFNLLPITPLDGEKIAEYFFPPSWARVLETIAPYGPIILLVILFVLPMFRIDILGAVMYPVLYKLAGLLIGGNG
jgi:Zn-dependent protease